VPTPSPDQTTLALVVMLHPAGVNLGRRFPLHRVEYTIGRLAELDIPIDTDSVSRRHARLVRVGDAWAVEDLGSTNGTFVNDRKVAGREMLADGDLVRCGEAILKFLTGSNVEAAYHEEIYRMSILDGLTSVHNKRFFQEFLDRELARANRHGGSMALIMFDIDHFKAVNDTHGHLAGDLVLKELCKRLKPRIRREDLLARYGGEEFACVLPDTDKAGAQSFAESVRLLVAREPFDYEGTALRVTISLGVAMHDPGVSSSELIRRADEHLYSAKRGGRNRVVGP
jgi:diguanylate cyclase (GGDEF)-like protein